MALTPEQKKARMLELAKASLGDLEEITSIKDDITDIIETNIGSGSLSEKIINELITLIENHYG